MQCTGQMTKDHGNHLFVSMAAKLNCKIKLMMMIMMMIMMMMMMMMIIIIIIIVVVVVIIIIIIMKYWLNLQEEAGLV